MTVADYTSAHRTPEDALDPWRADAEERKAQAEGARAARQAPVEAVARAEQERWNALFDARFDERFERRFVEQLPEETSSITEACGYTLHLARKETREHVKETVAKSIAAVEARCAAKIADLETPLKNATGELPQVKMTWAEGDVTYRNQLVSFNGSLFQARMDTGLRPGSDPGAWVCVACAGRNGRDAPRVTPQGQWDERDSYAMLDLVIHNDVSYLATHNDPGRPGDGEGGWQVIAAKGERGPQGERGPHGSRGEPGPVDPTLTIDAWTIDAERYRAIPKLSNGTVGAAVELRPLFAQFQRETSE